MFCSRVQAWTLRWRRRTPSQTEGHRRGPVEVAYRRSANERPLNRILFNALLYCVFLFRRLAGDQRARRDSRHDSDAEDEDDVKKVREQNEAEALFYLALHFLHAYAPYLCRNLDG